MIKGSESALEERRNGEPHIMSKEERHSYTGCKVNQYETDAMEEILEKMDMILSVLKRQRMSIL